MSTTLAGRFFASVPPGKSRTLLYLICQLFVGRHSRVMIRRLVFHFFPVTGLYLGENSLFYSYSNEQCSCCKDIFL